MPEPTQRWSDAPPTSVSVTPEPACPSEGLPLTLVSDRMPTLGQAPTTPVEFPGYEILGELGRGGMGVVYRARQRSLNRLVALKVILGGPLASSEDKARFRIEAEAAARLQHPNIVQVYDVGEHAGFSYMALELIEGETLRHWQNGKKIDPVTAARLAAAIARAIQHAHEQGIIHRDIKPANILLAPAAGASTELVTAVSDATTLSSSILTRPQSGAHAPLALSPKVTDFGLAKPLDGNNNLTMTGVACGTPNYMAPEQVRGKALGIGVDVYALGAVLYELLTGRPPFVGSDAPEVMNQILKTEAPPVRRFAPGVPRDLAVIAAKCLEKDPARRYATARDVAEDIDRYLAGKPISARPISSTERAWRWVKRNPVVAAFLCVSTIGFTLTTGLAVALAKSEGDERAAHAGADSARDEAEKQRNAAETARDGLKAALAAAEAARQLAEKEKAAHAAAKEAADNARELAKQEAKRAVEKQKEADAARARAEDNLRVARGVIRVSLRELSRHPRFEDEDFRDARVTLIRQVRGFRDTVAQHAPNTPEWLDDIADVSHWLGFLEYLNNNQDAAAAEYRTAADAAGRWAKLEPRKPEPRARQAHSLVNSGNALVNARRFREAEAAYREAIQLINAVVVENPREEYFRRSAVEASAQLANVLLATSQPPECEKAAREVLERAWELNRVCGEHAENLRWLAVAQLSLGKTLVRSQKWDEADCAFAECVAARERVRDAAPTVPRYTFEYASALLTQASFVQSRGQPHRAGEPLQAAVAVLEKGNATWPNVSAHATDLASGYTQYADYLRNQRQVAEAERLYDKAIEMTTNVLRGAPTFRPARDIWAGAATGRAHVYNQTGRHREAAAEWGRLAKEDPDARVRPRHELFVIQSLTYAGDWKAAQTAADAQMKNPLPGWMWLELGRAWCMMVRQIEADAGLTPADKLKAADDATRKAVTCLEKAKAAGEFATAGSVAWFTNNPEFGPVRGKFDPSKK